MTRLLPVVALLVACAQPAEPDDPDAFVEPSDPAAPFVLYELFTSEGCSSCPPADDLLNEHVTAGEPRVFPVAWHVDYWDYLGWPDPYGAELVPLRW